MAFTGSNTSTTSGSEFRNLDVLRATAVLCVFLAHLTLFLIRLDYLPVANQEIWGVLLEILGHLGVLYFFVHTALVLMLSLDRTHPAGLVLNFYIRRIFRIYPLCIACIIGILVLKVPQVPEGTYVPWDGREILANVLLVQNLFRKPDMIMPLWTLPREFQMYLVLPFIYLLLKRISSSVVVLILWFAFFAAVPSAPMLSCFPCFLAGVLAYQLGKQKVFRLPSAVWPAAIFALLVLAFVLNLTILPDYRADYTVCMLLGLVIPNVLELDESWITRASRSVARYSYGIYLCHDPVIWFSFVKLKSFPVGVRWAALVLLMVIVPVAAYRLLEQPVIEIGRRLAARWSAGRARREASRKGVFQESPQLAD
ncbi:MAG TPA: acyltransferase [Bryobacteraceae bacterium]|jgi:peptidoglycan/LPS O-acetylase OafA/YrhL|nr:acyltransferase [Bryobacteraceae bacterium]